MSAIDTAVAAVLAEHSQADTEEVRAGVTRVAERWTDADGDEQAMATFCKDHWVPAEDRHRLRDRLEKSTSRSAAVDEATLLNFLPNTRLWRPVCASFLPCLHTTQHRLYHHFHE